MGVLALVLCAALVLTISNGIRSSFGLFLTPMSLDIGFSRETFALAIAIQGLVWGISQPVFGALADPPRGGAGRAVGDRDLRRRAALDGLGRRRARAAPEPGCARCPRHQRHRVRGGARPGGSRRAAGEAQHGARRRGGRRLLRPVRAGADRRRSDRRRRLVHGAHRLLRHRGDDVALSDRHARQPHAARGQRPVAERGPWSRPAPTAASGCSAAASSSAASTSTSSRLICRRS